MGATTEIAWTHSTFNPWWGCVKVSDGCKLCYAERDSRRYGFKIWGQDGDRRFFGEKHWEEPRRWNAAAAESGERRRVFCASMADVFEDRRDLDQWRERLWRLIEETPRLDWLLLSKRPEHMQRLAPDRWRDKWPANVWAGATAESQPMLLRRWTDLALVPAAVRFLSCEPQLGPIELVCNGCGGNVWDHLAPDQGGCSGWFPDWVITGGESGPAARPYDLGWARTLLRQGKAGRIACFVKQLGADPIDGTAGCSVILRDRKGGDWNEWPEELRVRQFPSTPPSHLSPEASKTS